jgi:hypothetical protein
MNLEYINSLMEILLNSIEANMSLSLKFVTKLHKLLDDAQKYINVGKFYEK